MWKGLWRSVVQPSAPSRVRPGCSGSFFKTIRVLKAFMDGDRTVSLGNLLRCLTFPVVKKLPPVSSPSLTCFNSCLLPFVLLLWTIVKSLGLPSQ